MGGIEVLPKDPMILLSVINTKLRDNYSSLDELSDDLGESKEMIIKTLESVGYKYDKKNNQFI